MAKAEIKIEFCTSCGSKEIEVTGNKFYCPNCDVTYHVTKAGTKVVDTNPLGKEKTRIDQNAADIADLKGQKPAEPAPAEPDPVEPKPKAKDDDDDDEPDGFINWK